MAVLKGEAEKRMGALAFRLAYRHKPSFGHLSLTKLSLLIRKEYVSVSIYMKHKI